MLADMSPAHWLPSFGQAQACSFLDPLLESPLVGSWEQAALFPSHLGHGSSGPVS